MVLHDEGVAVGVIVGEVDEEAAVVRVVGVERQTEQPLLEVVVLDQLGQVEERLRQEVAVLVDDPDAADALDDEEPAAAVVGGGDVDRVGEPAGDLDELDGGLPGSVPPG